MSTLATRLGTVATFPVRLHIDPSLHERDRLTAAFRLLLAIPHLALVGGPVVVVVVGSSLARGEPTSEWVSGGGVFGAVAVVATLLAWLAIVITGRHPQGLWDLAALYLRWRVRAVAYLTLLRDEYPPFGDAPYPAAVEITPPAGERDRLTVLFRPLLALPHLVALWGVGIAWFATTVMAWFAVLVSGRFPAALYHFGVGALRWSTRVEAYLLLLCDDYPPFAFE